MFPNNVVSKELSKYLPLFSIETFDDELVGYTSFSFEMSKELELVFEKFLDKKWKYFYQLL